MGRVLPILLFAGLLQAFPAVREVGAQEMSGGVPPATDAPMAQSAFEALFQARADSALQNFAEEDVHFFTMMIPHHSQALEMSALAEARTDNRSILALAARISGGQSEEIERMRTWLEHRGIAEAETSMDHGEMDHGEMANAAAAEAMHDHADHDTSDHTSASPSMPGLLTPEEMDELASAEGPEFDRLFLSYMIYHHRGAITMVEDLFASPNGGKNEEVFRFAAEIRVDQSTEVARMERMLSVINASLALP